MRRNQLQGIRQHVRGFNSNSRTRRPIPSLGNPYVRDNYDERAETYLITIQYLLTEGAQ